VPFGAEPGSASTQPEGDVGFIFYFYFGICRVSFEEFFFKGLSARPNGSHWVLGGGGCTHFGEFCSKKKKGVGFLFYFFAFPLGLGVVLGRVRD